MAQIGMVIPVLNDADELDRLLAWRAEVCPDVPVWVVDAGSLDGTIKVAHKYGVTVLRALPGRAIQMNHGARAAIAFGCEALWFVHADAVPPDDAVIRIRSVLAGDACAGAFRRRFDHPSLFLRFTSWLADLRGRFFGWFLGDQGFFVNAQLFERLGGFPEWHVFEDLELSRRVRKAARTKFVRSRLLTSGRRFRRLGPIRQTWQDLRLTWTYLNCDDSPEICVSAVTGSPRKAAKEEKSLP